MTQSTDHLTPAQIVLTGPVTYHHELKMKEMPHLKIKKLNQNAMIPTYATGGSACFDLYAQVDEPVNLWAGNSVTVGTGLAFEIPDGYVMLVFSRSGHGFKNGITLGNGTGIIDSDYRGEVKINLTRRSSTNELIDIASGPFVINNGDRIGQAMLMACPKVSFMIVQELGETERGAGGFGSTGQ